MSTKERKEGWGSAEATEMVLNNIFYITAKVISKLKKVHFYHDIRFSLVITMPKRLRKCGPLYALLGLTI